MTQRSSDSLVPKPAATGHSARLVTVHAVNWHNVLDFTQIFRGFRLAINPAKITLALLAIMLIYVAGRVFDGVWGPQVYRGEIDDFATMSPERFREHRAESILQRSDGLRELLLQAADADPSLTPDRVRELQDQPEAAFRAIRAAFEMRFHKDLDVIAKQRADNERTTADTSVHIADAKSPEITEQESRRRAAEELLGRMESARDIAGHGVADSLMTYEIRQFDHLLDDTLGFFRVGRPAANDSGSTATTASSGDGAVSVSLVSKDPTRWGRSDTIAGCIGNMFIVAPEWLFGGSAPMQWRPANADTTGGWLKMIAYRGAYLGSVILYALFSLVLLAFTGASITRLTAMELAGIERPLLKEVFAFSARRLWTFIKAPTAPLLIILIIGLLIALGGLVGAIPLVGPVLLGIFFFIALAISFVLLLLILGILGGFNLLYPAIAVEGADSFDAMSRAFAYVYARPWRLLYYSLTALFYGVATFLFFSFAIYLLLLISHTFAGWGTNFFGLRYGSYSGLPKMETLWPTPVFLHLIQPANWYAMSWPEYVGSLFLHFWVYLLITSIGAFVISYYFSSHTIVYLLMRRAVEGQDPHEIYMAPPSAPSTPAAPDVLPATIAASPDPTTAAASGPAATSSTEAPPPPPGDAPTTPGPS